MKSCPKCSGTGKVGFEVDNGICYKCEGAGFIGASQDEINQAIESREQKTAKIKAIQGVSDYVYSKIVGRQVKGVSLSYCAIDLKGVSFSLNLKVSEATANLFDLAFVDNFSDIHNVTNPSNDTLKNQSKLSGKFAKIEKIGIGLIKVSFN